MAAELNLCLTEEQKRLLFSQAHPVVEQHNGIIKCKLCSPSLSGGDKNHTLTTHFTTKRWELADKTIINGCRLDTPSCSRPDSEESTRFHYHCPKCIDYSCRRKDRMEKHYVKCGGEKVSLTSVKTKKSVKLKDKFTKPSQSFKHSQCMYCNHIGLSTNMNRHIKDVHGLRPSLPATTIDYKKGLFMVRCAKSGYAKPVHAQFLTFNQEGSAVHCSQTGCQDFAKSAHRNGETAVLCIHLESCKLASPSLFEPLKRTAIDVLGLSDGLKDRLEDLLGKAFKDDKTPPIVLMNLNCDLKEANYLFFSCYNPSDKGISYSKRVITTLDISSCHFSCDCNVRDCIHTYLAQIYTHQLDSSLVLSAPKLPLTPNSDSEIETSEEFKDHVKLLNNVANYLYEEKKNDFDIPNPGLLSEDFSSLKKLVPREAICHHCKVNLSEPILIEKNAKIIRKELAPLEGVSVYHKVCPDCHMFYRYQEYTDGVHNFNDHVLVSVKLLEHLLLERNKVTPVEACLQGLNKEYGVPQFTYKNVTNALGHYMSLKNIPFTMNCYQCGPRPNVLIMDTTCKIAFNLTTVQKEEISKDTSSPYNSYEEFYADVCKFDIMLGLTQSAEILDLFRLKLSKNWLPFIGKNMVIKPQPSSTRCTFVENRPKNPFPISYDCLKSLAESGTSGTAQLNKLCSKLGLPFKKISNKQKMMNIVNADLCYDRFKKEFFALSGRSGGLLRGMCTHGITCAMKILIDPEGATDYAHCVFSFKDEYLSSVLCIDFAPHVGAHIQRVKPDFKFKHRNGALLPYSPESLERLSNDGPISEPTLNMHTWSYGPDTVDDPRFCIIDDFHGYNHKGMFATLHRRKSCIQLNKTFDSSRAEQSNKVVRPHSKYLNQQTPARHVKGMVYFMSSENKRLNTQECKKISAVGARSGYGEFEIGHDKPYFTAKKRSVNEKLNMNDGNKSKKSRSHDYIYSQIGDDSIFAHYEKDVPLPTVPETTAPKLPSISIKEAQPHVLLPNPVNNCWLNVDVNMLTAVGASDRLYAFHVQSGLSSPTSRFFHMLKSQNIDQHTVIEFAANCIETMRHLKVSLPEVDYYSIGKCQDAFEGMLTIFFPMMTAAGLDFKLSIATPFATLHHPSEDIRMCILDCNKGMATTPDFFFVQVNRGSGVDNGFSYPIPHEILGIGAHMENFVISSFIVHTGSRSSGHYTIYIKESSEFVYVSDEARRLITQEEFDNAATELAVTICYKKCLINSENPESIINEVKIDALDDLKADMDALQAEKAAALAKKNEIIAQMNSRKEAAALKAKKDALLKDHEAEIDSLQSKKEYLLAKMKKIKMRSPYSLRDKSNSRTNKYPARVKPSQSRTSARSRSRSPATSKSPTSSNFPDIQEVKPSQSRTSARSRSRSPATSKSPTSSNFPDIQEVKPSQSRTSARSRSRSPATSKSPTSSNFPDIQEVKPSQSRTSARSRSRSPATSKSPTSSNFPDIQEVKPSQSRTSARSRSRSPATSKSPTSSNFPDIQEVKPSQSRTSARSRSRSPATSKSPTSSNFPDIQEVKPSQSRTSARSRSPATSKSPTSSNFPDIQEVKPSQSRTSARSRSPATSKSHDNNIHKAETAQSTRLRSAKKTKKRLLKLKRSSKSEKHILHISSSDSSPERERLFKFKRQSSPSDSISMDLGYMDLGYMNSADESELKYQDEIWLQADVGDRRLDLRNKDKHSLDARKQITGCVMDSFMNIIKDQFKTFSYQSAILQDTFSTAPTGEDFIQIINLHSTHWIVLSDRLVVDPDTVYVYDSMYASKGLTRNPSPDLVTEYSKYAKALRPNTKFLKFVAIQQQASDSNDCGVFALNCAVHLARAELPLTTITPVVYRRKIADTLEKLEYNFELDFFINDDGEKSLNFVQQFKIQ